MQHYFAQLAAVLQALPSAPLLALRDLIIRTRERGGTVWLAGNGGSCANAQHWACDLRKTAGIRALALGAETPALTAWANDTRYDQVFAADIERLARPGDCLIVLSCSGSSPNVTVALMAARSLHILAALVTGDRRTPALASVVVCAPATDYAIIEDCHAAIGHWLTKELSG